MARRRGRGEGTTGRRKDGGYHGRIDLGWNGSYRLFKFIYARTVAERDTKLHVALEEHRKGAPIVSNDPTVEELATDWLETSVRLRAKPRSYDSFRSIQSLTLIQPSERSDSTLSRPVRYSVC